MNERFSQDEYLGLGQVQSAYHAAFRKGLAADQQAALAKYARRPNPRTDEQLARFQLEEDERYATALAVTKNLLNARWGKGATAETMQKAGISTGLGYNFYDLRAPVYLMYPVNTPMRNSLAREGPVNAGVGTAANWKGTRNVGTQPISIPEGFRAPIRVPDENDYVSKYKEFGTDSSMTFTAQWAGEGLTDNLADDHLRALQALWLGEEGTIWNGNGGTGVNGVALGTPATPALAQSTTAAGTLAAPNTLSVAVVMLTEMGYPANNQFGYGASHSVAGGLIPSQVLSSAVGESYTMPGGTSKVSALSAMITLTGGNNTVTATVTNKPGAFSFAWYVSMNGTPTLANANLYAITNSPSVTIIAPPGVTQTANAAGLTVDNSFNTLEFTGLIPMVANLAGSWTVGNNWTDLKGASLTAGGHGKVNEVETILANCFTNFQTGYTDIWGSPDAVTALSAAVVASGTSGTGFQFVVNKDSQNNITGGSAVSGYLSRYAVNSPTGANIIPLRMHPMIPAGTLYFHIGSNPYPHSRIGNVLAALIQRDYYSIEWPVTSRDWTFGTYVQYVLAHRLPWIPSVLTGIGSYTGV
jgi:hypothetical protein